MFAGAINPLNTMTSQKGVLMFCCLYWILHPYIKSKVCTKRRVRNEKWFKRRRAKYTCVI